MQNSSLKPDIVTSQDLSLGALSYTTSIGRRFRLERILFHASVAITETITITLDSVGGATYDTVLRKKSLSAEQDFIYIPDGENNYYAGDEIKIECTNANITGILYANIKTREVLI
jgi:hypothetical protein